MPEIPPSPPETAPEEIYEGKFSLAQRFYRLLTEPTGAMKDIALAPDYGGISVLIAIDFVLTSITIAIVLQKIQLSGPYAERISNMVLGLLAVAVILAVILFVAKWAIKCLIVKHACDSGSGWNFKIAASVTGYAYIADIIVNTLKIFVILFLDPTFHVDTTNLEAAIQALNDYQAQLNWLKLAYSLPLSLLGLLWKSYLGGLGAHFGTKGKCSLRTGIAVFVVLSLIGLLIAFILQ